MTVEWLAPSEAAQETALAPGEAEPAQAIPAAAFARVLVADMRDPLVLPLLRPAPSASDYRDEARPGASDRSYFLARRAALRSLLGFQARCPADDVRIAYDEPGAPRVHNPAGYYVSVSGRGPLAALAVSNNPVGVDMEPLDGTAVIVEDILHARDRVLIRLSDPDIRQGLFLRIWTAKEAYLKALGSGLNIDPASFYVEWCDGDSFVIGHDGRAELLAGQIAEYTLDNGPVIAACVVLRASH